MIMAGNRNAKPAQCAQAAWNEAWVRLVRRTGVRKRMPGPAGRRDQQGAGQGPGAR